MTQWMSMSSKNKWSALWMEEWISECISKWVSKSVTRVWGSEWSRSHWASFPDHSAGVGMGEGRDEDPLEKEMVIQYSSLEKPMDRGAWRVTAHGVEKCWTWLSDWTATNCTLGSHEIWLSEQLKWSFKICLVFSLYERQISIIFLWGQLYGSLCPQLENSGNYSLLSTWNVELTGWQLLRSDKNPWNIKCFFTDTS